MSESALTLLQIDLKFDSIATFSISFTKSRGLFETFGKFGVSDKVCVKFVLNRL